MRHGRPSGDQIEIRSGDQRVVVVEVGGGLRSYRVGGLDVLDGYDEHELATAGRGQVLMPWPNSLAVEPMTCAPNAFRTGAGVRVLEPGASTTSTWGIEA